MNAMVVGARGFGWRSIGAISLWLVVACSKQGAPTVDPEASALDPGRVQPQGQAPSEDEAVPTDAAPEGETGDEGDEGDATSEDEDGDTAPAEDAAPDLEALHAKVDEALDAVLDPYAARLVTPLLPTEWPPTSGTVMALSYSLTPLESGVTRYTVSGATHRVTIDLRDGTVRTEALSAKKKIGTMEQTRSRADDPVHDGERALIDVVAGRIEPDKVRFQLARYVEWADRHALVGGDLDRRAKAFMHHVRGLGLK